MSNLSALKSALAMLALVLVCQSTVNANPEVIGLRGVLLDKPGSPVNGTLSITFRIYDSPSGGTPLWSEVQQVQVSNGVFNVHLGEISPIPSSLFEKEALYIGVQVGIDPEMTPRQPLTSEGFVFNAKR